jgi:hypothetical protein
MTTTNYVIYCPCTNTKIPYMSWASHFCSNKHQEWYVENEDNVNSMIVTCPCKSIDYNFKNAHNHFKNKDHRAWESLDDSHSRGENVLIICKCGDIIRYKDRILHNKIHRMPIFQKSK